MSVITKPFNIVYKSNSPYKDYTETAILNLKLAPNDMQDFENLLGIIPYVFNKTKTRTYIKPLLIQDIVKQFRSDKMISTLKLTGVNGINIQNI